MPRDEDLSAFKRRLLVFPPLLISAVCLPMALGLIAPNPLYGFRTSASLASANVWYQSNFSAGIAGVVLGIAGALLNYRIVGKGKVSTTKALLTAGVTVSVAFGSTITGLLVADLGQRPLWVEQGRSSWMSVMGNSWTLRKISPPLR